MRKGGAFRHFSLDAVAEEAGVSKGGLTHHFASKDALLTAVAKDAMHQFEQRVFANVEEGDGRSGTFLKAYIDAVFDEEIEINSQLSPMLLSYVINKEPDSRFAFWQQFIEADGLDKVTATIIRLAIDGLIYTEMIDNAPIEPELREQIRERLLGLVG